MSRRLTAGWEICGGNQIGLLLEVLDALAEGIDGGLECLAFAALPDTVLPARRGVESALGDEELDEVFEARPEPRAAAGVLVACVRSPAGYF
jgi:hypothetical protein